MKLYLDSNVFIFAALFNDHRGDTARKILKKIAEGNINACTSALTIDEVLWSIQKLTKDRNLAIDEGFRILQLHSLKVGDVTARTIQRALELMKKYQTLAPRDAIHVSVSLEERASEFVTDDSDFDKITEIKRKNLDSA